MVGGTGERRGKDNRGASSGDLCPAFGRTGTASLSCRGHVGTTEGGKSRIPRSQSNQREAGDVLRSTADEFVT
jgi:hypothetical protein